MSTDQLIDPRTGMPMRVYEAPQQGGSAYNKPLLRIDMTNPQVPAINPLIRMYNRSPASQGGLESLINPAMTDPGGADDRAAMMAMQRDTFLPYLTGNPSAGDDSTEDDDSVEDNSFTGGVATDQANPVAVTSGQAGIVPMTEGQMGNLAYQDMGTMPISNAGFMNNLNYNPYSSFQTNEGIGAFEYDPNIGPAANVAGDALALYTGLGYIPEFGERFANVFSKGFSNLGDLVNKIPGVGAITSRIGDVLNRGAAPIEKFVDDSVNPLGITGALLERVDDKTVDNPIRQAITDLQDRMPWNVRASMERARNIDFSENLNQVDNIMDSLSPQSLAQSVADEVNQFSDTDVATNAFLRDLLDTQQIVDPTIMDTQQSVDALVDSLSSPTYDGVLLGSSPFASSITPFGVGDDAITGRWDSSLRNLPSQPGTVESGMVYDYDAPTQTFMDRAIDAMITSAGTGGGTVGSMGGGGGSIGGGGFTGGVAGGGKKTDPVDAGG
tara:strand:- start:23061 stop:24551 length:1491 start_codon:yes stop_codon:yes gene_type:complete